MITDRIGLHSVLLPLLNRHLLLPVMKLKYHMNKKDEGQLYNTINLTDTRLWNQNSREHLAIRFHNHAFLIWSYRIAALAFKNMAATV